MDSDILFPVKNNFQLGAYQAAIAEAADLEALSDAQRLERDIHVYRSYIELGSYELVINEVSASAPQALQAIKLLAQYCGNKIDKEAVFTTLQNWLEDSDTKGNPTVLLVAGLIYAKEEKHVEALKACHAATTLELLAISVQVCLQMSRVDHAEKYVKAMIAKDEDATITQLAGAWVNLAQGGAKVQEAYFIYQELGERYNWTVRLLNSSAVCSMRMGEWEAADKLLQEAYEKDAKNPETLANLVSVGLHLKRSVTRHMNFGAVDFQYYESSWKKKEHTNPDLELYAAACTKHQLRTVAAHHPTVQQVSWAEEQFERASSALVAA